MAIELNGIGNSLNPRVRSGDQPVARDTLAAASSAAASSAADRVELSAHAQNLYKNDEEGTFDSARVEAIKKQIADGNYEVDYQKLAGKLMDLESRL
jgi:negative regulator of flagellin synthesis FlgM